MNEGVKESNEAEVPAILEALQIYSSHFQYSLIMENDSQMELSGC